MTKRSSQVTPELIFTLREISNAMLYTIRTHGVQSVLDPKTTNMYRSGFERTDVKARLLEPWKHSEDVDITKMAVEVITVSKEMLHEIHFHDDAYAIITFLGTADCVPEPSGSFFFYKSKENPMPARSGITLDVPPGTVHGFTCPPGANPLKFLSVQSKRIEEDFVVV